MTSSPYSNMFFLLVILRHLWCSTLLSALYSWTDTILCLTTTTNIKLLVTDVRIREITVPRLRSLRVLAFKTSAIQKKQRMF